MKKLLFIFLSCCLLISFVACGDGQEEDSSVESVSDSVDTSDGIDSESAESESAESESAESESTDSESVDSESEYDWPEEEESPSVIDRWTSNH